MHLSHDTQTRKILLKAAAFILIMVVLCKDVQSQCSLPISAFPYRETFESSSGNWIPGGTNSDWSWGSPVKAVISSAGEGTKSWVTGGLTASSYNGAQNSTLESPCFDFTNLDYPQVRFKIFWETERRFDGAVMQYSNDGGNSWNSIGDINSNSNCQGQNWYNTPSVTYLGNIPGWSGNVQANSGSCLGGNGSSSWLTASHTLSFLAGEPSVKLRFVFGSGTTCNAFDGFAIDDIVIEELPPNSASVGFSCLSASSVAFTSTTNCAVSTVWNFGDPGSGANNVSSLPNPGHTYTTPGTYNVTMVASFASGAPVTKNLIVTILQLATSVLSQPTCNGSQDGSVQATATGASGPLSYSWNTTPPQTGQILTGLGAGTYTVNVNAPNACSISGQVELVSPGPIIISPVVVAASCSLPNGSVSATVTGGTAPYQYAWSNGGTTNTINDLDPGFYSVSVSDAKGCSSTASGIEIINNAGIPGLELGEERNICPGDVIILNAGNFSNYLWQDNSTGSTFRVSMPGLYYVTVQDTRGCSATDSVKVTMDCNGIYFPSAFSPNGDYLNENFGPLGSLGSVSNYTLFVFNRFGERIFYSTNPYQKWNGNYKGLPQQTGAYTWFATYKYNGKSESVKAVVLLIR